MQEKLIVCATALIETSPQALPLGAACIASSLKASSDLRDFRVELVAVSLEEKNHDLVQKILACGKPSYVMLSVYVWNREELENTARVLKEMISGLVVIAGGPEVTARPDSFENFDWCISGSGEEASVKIVKHLEKIQEYDVKGTDFLGIFKNGDKNCLYSRTPNPDPQILSSPYLDGTIRLKEYGGALWELARGCPFKCSYCYESKGEKKIKYFPMERIEKELELFNREKISQVFVLDPTYNANRKRALELLDLISKKAPGIFFYFEARAEFIDRELARAFTKIPCALQFGLQSADPEILKKVNRTLDKKIFTRNIGYLNETGAVFGFDLIYGLPGDTLEGFRKSIDFALNLYPNNLETFCLSVLPGTDLYEQAENLNLIYEKVPPYHVLKTDRFSEKDLEKASCLSTACSLFYNEGRSVSWFNSVCHVLKMRPVILLEEFERWFSEFCPAGNKNLKQFYDQCPSHEEIEKVQLDFLKKLFESRGKSSCFEVCRSVVKFNGALSRLEAERKIQVVELSYHPDDVASEYSTDFQFFSKNCTKFKCTVQFFYGKNGADWKVLKR